MTYRSIRIPTAAMLAVWLLVASGSVQARPVYAIKEGRTCAYCHVNPAGGGPRNPRGVYYASHKHTFEGYNEEAVMGRPGANVFRLAWKETLLPTTLKVAVAPTTPDGVNRLILLQDTGGQTRKLEVRKWDGRAWATEFNAAAPEGTDRLAAGKFAAESPAVIVTTRALWYWDGLKYAMRNATRPVSILGSVILIDGSEKLLVKEGTSMKMYSIDPKSANWLVNGQDPPPSSKATFFEMKGRTEELTAVGVPDALAGGGVFGLWDAGKPQQLFYAVAINARVDPGQQSNSVAIKGQDTFLIVVDPRSQTMKTIWRSDKLAGPVFDVALNDPRGQGRGLAVLTTGVEPGASGKTLYFFQLE